MFRKIKSNIVLAPLGLAGASVGFGLIGDSLNSQPLKEAGTTTGGFVAPAVNIAAGGLVIGMLKDIKNSSKSLKIKSGEK